MTCIVDLQYLADGTRYDISFSTALLVLFLPIPTTAHLSLLKHVVIYLQGMQQNGLHFNNSASDHIFCFSDSDYAEAPGRRCSSASIRSGIYVSKSFPTRYHNMISYYG